MLKILFPNGIPVEAYDRLPEILQRLNEARALAAPPCSALEDFVAAHLCPDVGSRLLARECYEAYARWCHERDVQPGECMEVMRALEGLGVRTEQTAIGWHVVGRILKWDTTTPSAG